MSKVPIAAVLVIGDEILSGRTQDSNSHYIARLLAASGIDLKEIRVVGDVEDKIMAALNALRAAHDFVFTTGGIGPTHDDITADAVAKAFGVAIGYDPTAYTLLETHYGAEAFNGMRKRMARIPLGATLIKNSASVAPGFRMGNVFVLAGVPMVMRAMMEAIMPTLPHGAAVTVITVNAAIAEGLVAPGLARVQQEHPNVAIGSYPWYRPENHQPGYGVELVARGRDADAVERAARDIEVMLTELGAKPTRIT